MTAKRKPKAISDITVYCRFDASVDISELIPNPRNPNQHPDKQIALLAKIIRAQGWRNPIVVSNRSGFVVKGHGRLQAAQLLQVSHAPVEYQDYVTEAEEYADLIADNRIAELAEPDSQMLKDLLQDLDTGANDMDLTGFGEEELERLMTQFHPELVDPAFDEDEKSKLTVTCFSKDKDNVKAALEQAVCEYEGSAVYE